jgi:hypothetical protein
MATVMKEGLASSRSRKGLHAQMEEERQERVGSQFSRRL